MSLNQPIRDLKKAEGIPQGTAYVASMGDGSGVKAVTQEVLTKAVGEGLKIGNPEELQTENKESLVGAINEVMKSGGNGGTVDILDTPEEVEANTEAEKVAGALAVKEMFSALNDKLGLETRENPSNPTQAQWKNSNGDWVNFRKALVKVGQATSASATINISNIGNYEQLTSDDFIAVMVSCSAVLNTSRDIKSTLDLTPELFYNSNTGVITVSGISKNLTGWNGVSYSVSAVVDVYMVK